MTTSSKNRFCASGKRRRRRTDGRRGGALLAVLWLSAALSAIAFSVASNVRTEIDRSITLVEGMQARYLAEGAVQAAILKHLSRQQRRGVVEGRQYFSFPNGEAVVELIPETSRLSLNRASQEDLARLLMALGVTSGQAVEIAAGIVDWRSGGGGAFDSYYLAQTSSFRARHASIQETEEVLFVKGMTPEIFYGRYVRDAQGRLRPRGGFRDCVSPQGTMTGFDPRTAEPALLLALGVPPAGVEQIVRVRNSGPLGSGSMEAIRAAAGPAAGRLRLGGNTIYTFRATAELRDASGRPTGVRRSSAATVKFFEQEIEPPYQILRWYESPNSEVAFWQ